MRRREEERKEGGTNEKGEERPPFAPHGPGRWDRSSINTANRAELVSINMGFFFSHTIFSLL